LAPVLSFFKLSFSVFGPVSILLHFNWYYPYFNIKKLKAKELLCSFTAYKETIKIKIMKKTILSIILFASCFAGKAQKLTEFTQTVQPDVSKGKCYISITNKQVYTESEGASVKQALDFVYTLKRDGRDTVKEFYNMSGKSSVVPQKLQGTATGIVSLSWDKDLWNKCVTVADLKRMAGHITNNSFSFYSVIANNHTGEINYPCFVFQLESGKRGIMYVIKADDNAIRVTVKLEP
jgi:hypothetical protein